MNHYSKLKKIIPVFVLFTGLIASALLWNPQFDLEHVLEAPSFLFSVWALGGDAFGRPLLMLIPRGAASSLLLGATAAISISILALILSCLILMLTESTRKIKSSQWIADASLRTVDFFLAFPSLLFSLASAAILGPGWITLMLSLWIGHLPNMLRLLILRGQEITREDFWICSESLGSHSFHRAYRHLVPALTEIIALKLPGLFAGSLIAEATLSFLGIGAPVGRLTWGSLLAQGKDYLVEAPQITIATGIPLILTVWALMQIKWKNS